MVIMYGMVGGMKREAKQKVTFVFDAGIVERIKREVETGAAASKSGLVQEAVAEYLSRREREALRAAYARAAADPSYASDVENVMNEFEVSDGQADVE